jgi:hypothetical protein
VRASGTALAAQQQQADIAYAGAQRTMEKGNAAVTLGGLKFKNSIADLTAASSLLTAQYARTEKEYRRKIKQLGGTPPDEVVPVVETPPVVFEGHGR